jgi:ubiquinone/menaquinone biosynthesis C-methylase UbiE
MCGLTGSPQPAMHVLEGLARRRKLLNPGTRQPLDVRDGRVLAADGRELGRLPGPLNLLPAAEQTMDPAHVPRDEIERVRAHLELPPGGAVDAEIARAIAATGTRFGQAHLSAEANMLAERFKIPEFQLDRPPVAPGPERAGLMARIGRALGREEREAAPRLEHLSNSVGGQLRAGVEAHRSVRVRNTGGALPAAGASVETRFVTAEGTPAADCVVANALPVDLAPGREITLILKVRVPARAGRYTLRCHLAAPGASAQPFLELPVDASPCDPPSFDFEYHPELLEYGNDHHIAAHFLLEYLKQAHPGKAAEILEIGGGVHPTGFGIATHGHRVVSSDISHAQSILGTLFFRHKMPHLDQSLAFVSCDGTELPFGDEAFDGAMFFAAFHHFADPVALLKEVRRATRPGGFVYIACDCCVPEPADAMYREELARGINEQVWTLPEYTGFFRAAGLRVARARVDFHSLKAILVRAEG